MTPESAIYLKSKDVLGLYPEKLTERLDYWAEQTPDCVFLAARQETGDWRTVTYRQFRRAARSVAQSLLGRWLSPDRPITILSENDIEHAILAAGAMYAGVPYCPVSPAYSLRSRDFTKLRHVLTLLEPQLVFASDGDRFRPAIEACVKREVEVVITQGRRSNRAVTYFSALAANRATAIVDQSHEQVHGETIAKVLFTSGATGTPKGVINTHRMLTSNQEMLRSVLPSLSGEPPVLCDWLPWHHTFGGNHNFGLVLYNGGTLYIDGGKPTPEGAVETLRNLREIAPTLYFNVPRGFELLASALRAEPALRRTFFSQLREMFCAAAALSQTVSDELDHLAFETIGRRIPLYTGFGSTETGPLAFSSYGATYRAGVMGSPVPGVEAKLVPNGNKLELRVRGPNVTPGYWRDCELTRNAFDEEGFLGTGDAVSLLDPADALSVLVFEGRLAEDFKLSTGTWVNVSPLRSRLLHHCGSLIQDAVIAGHGRADVTALVFVDGKVGRTADARASLEIVLKAFARQGTGASTRIARAAIVTDPLSFEAGELTDKGTVNQRAVLETRAQLVEDLYAFPVPPHVIPLSELPAL